jgi:hypothetical protein
LRAWPKVGFSITPPNEGEDMNTHSSRLLVALSLTATLTGGCLATTPAVSVQSEGDPPAGDPTQPEDETQEDEPVADVPDPHCRLQPQWTAC